MKKWAAWAHRPGDCWCAVYQADSEVLAAVAGREAVRLRYRLKDFEDWPGSLVVLPVPLCPVPAETARRQAFRRAR